MKKTSKLFNVNEIFDDYDKKLDEKYNSKIIAPIYRPKLQKPSIFKLFDSKKTNELIKEIKNANIDKYEKKFLIAAARRHTVFNYGLIADYYAHSNKEMQSLMEKSALVIIDFNSAIEYGYVKLADEIAEQYLEDKKC